MFGLFETGFQFFYWGNLLMLVIGGALIYLGISKKMEPLLLVPIGFGMMLVNLPLGGLMDYELSLTNTMDTPARVTSIEVGEASRIGEGDVILKLDSGEVLAPVHGRVSEVMVTPGQEVAPGGVMAVMRTTAQTPLPTTPVGLFSRIFQYGIMWQIIPPLIFLCLGALTDFGPMIANPKTLLLGGAAQFGVYFAFFADHLRYLAPCPSPDRCHRGSLLFLYGAGAGYPAPHHQAAHHQTRASHLYEAATA